MKPCFEYLADLLKDQPTPKLKGDMMDIRHIKNQTVILKNGERIKRVIRKSGKQRLFVYKGEHFKCKAGAPGEYYQL